MTAIELNAKKMEIIQMLLTVNNEQTVAKILSYVRKSKGTEDNPPCRFTVEQMRQRIAKAETEIEAGRFIPHEEIKRKAMPR